MIPNPLRLIGRMLSVLVRPLTRWGMRQWPTVQGIGIAPTAARVDPTVRPKLVAAVELLASAAPAHFRRVRREIDFLYPLVPPPWGAAPATTLTPALRLLNVSTTAVVQESRDTLAAMLVANAVQMRLVRRGFDRPAYRQRVAIQVLAAGVEAAEALPFGGAFAAHCRAQLAALNAAPVARRPDA